MADIFRIVYCSRKIIGNGNTEAELAHVLCTSQRNNAVCDVTGALMYNEGIFAQVLEGPYDAVQTVFERIQIDPRHDDVIILQADTVTERQFDGWSMADATPENPTDAKTVLSPIIAGTAGDPDDVIGLLGRVLHSRSYA